MQISKLAGVVGRRKNNEAYIIATSHPGRCGDAIFCLPTIKALCSRHNCQTDFYTSDWCAPIAPLMLAQPFIRKFIISPGYMIEAHGIGIQPWKMPIDASQYEAVYQLGFKTYPVTPIPDHIAASEGFPPLPLALEYPKERVVPGDYLVACSKSFNECALAFPESPMFFQDMNKFVPVLTVGLQCLRQGLAHEGYAKNPANLLEVAGLIHHSKGVLCSPSTIHTIASFIPSVRMVTLKHHWLDRRQMWDGTHQLVFDAPRADVAKAREWLGI
jgi:hypothetical protein